MPLVLNGTTGVQDNSGAFVAGTIVTASTTAVDFTGIPSWVKRVTLVLRSISTNGTSVLLVQIGSGSIVTSGYDSTGTGFGFNSTSSVQYTTGFGIEDSGSATWSRNGAIVLTTLGNNNWVINGGVYRGTTFNTLLCGGIALGGALDRVRLTTVNGTDTFDAGTINILYE
jgi:hypothetical protein